ncbi:MAG: hypothetical protein HC855_04225 [Rhizobiales bacterium]|nr:hypothetical protein [Hyphomicrobiales bacterium]
MFIISTAYDAHTVATYRHSGWPAAIMPAMFFFHTGDAWEDADGTLRFDLCVTPDAEFVTHQARSMIRGGDAESPQAELVMAVLHPNGRAEVQRTGLRGEFPQTDRRRQGLRRLSRFQQRRAEQDRT